MKKAKQYRSKKLSNKKYKRPGLLTGRAKGYDSWWGKYRHRFLYHNPTCYSCGDKSKHVDHIKRTRDNPEAFEELTNHLPLCHSCHSVVTAKFDRGKEQDLEGKIKWLQAQRKLRNLKSRVKVLKSYITKK